MKKRILAFALAALMLVPALTGAALAESFTAAMTPDVAQTPAFQGGTADAEMEQVTVAVKKTLGITGDEFDAFDGYFSDEPSGRLWFLSWSSDYEGLSVTADDSGKIYSMNRYMNNYSYNYSSFYGFDPKLPAAVDLSEKADVQSFLSTVLGEGESCALEDDNSYYYFGTSSSDCAYYSGSLIINGLESPIYISVQTEGGRITSFSRSDCYSDYVGSVPAPTAKVTTDEAAQLLKTTLGLELRYEWSDADGMAVLRYMPVYTGEYVVDADGKLVNMDEVYNDAWNSDNGADMATGAAEAPAEAASEEYGLTDYEQDSVSQLEGVMGSDELDVLLKADSRLGLDGYTLRWCNYSVDYETGEVSCYIDYYKWYDKKDQSSFSKSVSVDAKTGALISVNTSYPYRYEPEGSLSDEERSAAEREAIEAYFPGLLAQCEPYEAPDYYGRYDNSWYMGDTTTYAQKVNGYFYPTNSVEVGINSADGTIDQLYSYWDESVSFAPADKLADQESVLNSYAALYDVGLRYIEYPIAVTPGGIYDAYAAMGYGYVTELRAAFTAECDDYIYGFDAVTGQLVELDDDDYQTDIAYDDLDGAYGRDKIEALAEMGIGFEEPQLRPNDALTELDMAKLLISACGGYYSYAIDSEYAYEEAAGYGFVDIMPLSERTPDRAVTRMEFISAIVGASKYGYAAELSGIFTCGYADAALLAAEDVSAASIAWGLGMARGDSDGNLDPYAPVTRQDAIIILYNFMVANTGR